MSSILELLAVEIDQLRTKSTTNLVGSLATLVLPLLLVHLYRKYLLLPSAERAARVGWTTPAEAAPGWVSFELASPSLHSHLDEPSLLPPSSPSDPKRSYITCYAPASGHHLATINAATPDEIKECIRKAGIAQLKWRQTSFAQRRKVLRTILEWTVDNMEGIARVASRDTGKTMVDAAFGEILTTCEKLRWVMAYGEEHLKPEARPTNMILAHKVSHVHYEPLGIVSCCVSWNYPFHNVLGPIIAALFTGNAIVVKPSEQVAWSSSHFIDAVRKCLEACGHDPEVVQIVLCLPESVEALTGDTRIKHITFIGSEEVGKKVAIKGAQVGTPVLLELGGKDPCIVLESADLKYFYPTWLRAAFQAAGQNCIGVERFLVHSSIYDTFVTEMTARVSDLQVNDVLSPSTSRTDVGAMVTDRLFDQLESLIASAVAEGARLLVGGKRYHHPQFPKGHYFQPTLLVDVTPSMAIARQEVFAPVMTVMRFETKEEAVERANSTRYGLGASVFGRSKRDCEFVVENIQSGMVCTNDFGVFYLNQSLPFGGCKSSGYGRFAGPEGLRGLCNLKSVTRDRFHGLIQTGIPPLLAYPILSGSAAWGFVSGLVRLMYGKGMGERAGGLWGLLTAKP